MPTPTERKQRRFWDQLLRTAERETELHTTISPQYKHTIAAAYQVPGVTLAYTILADSSRISLDIDTGDKRHNKALFDQLYTKRHTIEGDLDADLDWERKDEHKYSTVEWYLDTGGWDDDVSQWADIQDTMITAMIRFERALRPHVAALHR